MVREKAGIFDVSHMGEIEVTGEKAEGFVRYLMTNDVTRLKDKQVQYTLMCYPDGGVVDDLLVYRFRSSITCWWLMPAIPRKTTSGYSAMHRRGFRLPMFPINTRK